MGRTSSTLAMSPSGRSVPLPMTTIDGLPMIGAATRREPLAMTAGSSSVRTSGPAVLISTKICPVAAVSAPFGPR